MPMFKERGVAFGGFRGQDGAGGFDYVNLADNLRLMLERRGLQEACVKAHRLRRCTEDLRAGLHVLQAGMGTWERLAFHPDPEDEQAENQLAADLKREQAGLEKLERKLKKAFQRVADEIPPFEIGQRIEHICILALSPFQIGRPLPSPETPAKEIKQALLALSKRIGALWVPDLDTDALSRVLDDKKACRRWAKNAPELKAHYYMGVAPVSNEQMLAMVAAASLSDRTDLFTQTRTLARQEKKVQRLRENWIEAGGQAPWSAWNNLFSDSKAEWRLNQIAGRLKVAVKKADGQRETVHLLQQKALEAYPPMAIYQAAGRALAALEQLDAGQEVSLAADGVRRQVRVATGRALLLAAVAGLRQSFHRAFPDVLLPGEVGLKEQTKARLSPRQEMLAEACQTLDRLGAGLEIQRSLSHALSLGALERSHSKLRALISWTDRVYYWDQTKEEKKEEEIENSKDRHESKMEAHWRELLGMSRQASEELGVMKLRDLALDALRLLNEVSVKRGWQSSQPSLRVRGKKELLRVLVQLKEVLTHQFYMKGGRRSFMKDVVRNLAAKKAAPVRSKAFRLASQTEVIESVAYDLRETNFVALFEAAEQAVARHSDLEWEQEGVTLRISTWDRINIFHTTPDERRHKELAKELSELDEKQRQNFLECDALLEGALDRVYPPGRLYYALDGLRHRVEVMKAQLQTRTKGATRYRCVLQGKAKVEESLKSWTAMLVRVFGPLPTATQLLDIWASRDGSGRPEAWLRWDPEARGTPPILWKPKI